MADKSDVEIALVQLISGILYPNGTTNPPILTSYPARVRRGQPTSASLDADLAAGISRVSVVEQPGFTRVTPGYLDPPIETPATPTLTVTGTGPTITISGTPGAGQLVGVKVDGVAYAYALTGADTLTTAAAALAAMVTGATSVGPVMTFASTAPILARVSCMGTFQTRPRWQAQGFRVSVWAPTPAARDAIAGYVDQQLSATYFIALPDGQGARMEYRNTFSDDAPQKEQLWKRDIYYTVQFATSITTSAPQVLFEIDNIQPTTQQDKPLGAAFQIVG